MLMLVLVYMMLMSIFKYCWPLPERGEGGRRVGEREGHSWVGTSPVTQDHHKSGHDYLGEGVVMRYDSTKIIWRWGFQSVVTRLQWRVTVRPYCGKMTGHPRTGEHLTRKPKKVKKTRWQKHKKSKRKTNFVKMIRKLKKRKKKKTYKRKQTL